MDILDLTTDAMILIFKLLTPSDRRRVITVCHKWLDVVNGYFSEDHCLLLTSYLDYTTTGSLYRTFSDRSNTHLRLTHLVIKDANVEELSEMRHLIELIGNEVKSLKLEYISSYPRGKKVAGLMLEQNLFAKLPNLESVETNSNFILANLSSVNTLKRVKVFSVHDFEIIKIKMEHLNNCRKIKGLESLTVSVIQLSGIEMGDKSLVPFLELHTKTLLSQLMPRNNSIITLEAPTFNFCGEAQLTQDDISGIRMTSSYEPVPSEILSQFKNLKRLECHSFSSYDPLVLSGVTKLKLSALGLQPTTDLDRLLQRFPDLESLDIYAVLKKEQFLLICQFMPKLKKLVLRLEISLDTVIDGYYSLKDLRFLEKLGITTESQCNSGQWPHLPELKVLSLRGDGFRHLNRDFYSQIAEKSPKITDVTISYRRGYKLHHLLPLMSQLKLTHLHLYCERDTGYNSQLVPNLIEYCQELKDVFVNDPIDFSLSQEIQLFSNIPSLMTIMNGDRSGELNRMIERKDAANLKRYLSKNLSLYKNLRATIDYVAKHVIPPNEYQEMCQSFQRINNERRRDLYIVTHVFLGMCPESVNELFDCYMNNIEYSELNLWGDNDYSD